MFTTIDHYRARDARNFFFGVARLLGIRSRSRQVISRTPASAR